MIVARQGPPDEAPAARSVMDLLTCHFRAKFAELLHFFRKKNVILTQERAFFGDGY